MNGDLINTDFIENSAGVDCSDHEVNIKILLNEQVDSGIITQEEKNSLLAKMDDQICRLVLYDNDSQSLVMSYSSFHSYNYVELYLDHIKQLEEGSFLDREFEYLPSIESLTFKEISEVLELTEARVCQLHATAIAKLKTRLG